jgi:biofilm PGA synthesis N-glycosyltransferase PgaC
MSPPRLGTSVVVSGLLAAATGGHVLYPAWLAWRTRGGRGRVAIAPRTAGPGASPDLTVVVPAYREARVIADKVDDLRANGYPGSLEILARTASASRRRSTGALRRPRRPSS